MQIMNNNRAQDEIKQTMMWFICFVWDATRTTKHGEHDLSLPGTQSHESCLCKQDRLQGSLFGLSSFDQAS
ncbi:hypothetical protein DAI22_07g140200 [Oryza sativa Japonica Group]|nr:hypothetical protein DAI22_07g140200 [Oryza sativa Japonica Group]